MVVKRLVIIGNGFDLSCELPSSFLSYFKYREKHNSEYEGFLQVVKELQDDAIDTKDIRSENGRVIWSNAGMLSGNLNTARKTVFHKFSFWDYWFYIHQDGITNWTDVEKLVSDFFEETTLKESWANSVLLELKKLQEDVEKMRREQMFGKQDQDILVMEGQNPRENDKRIVQQLCFALYHNFQYPTDKQNEDFFYNFLKSQLTIFEEGLKSYLKDISEKETYSANAAKLMEKISGTEDYSLLSFNYTHPASIKPAVMSNVHGSLDGEIVIGVDAGKFHDNPAAFRFTNTYRIMTMASQVKESVLVKPLETIAFYGHSLSQADYSYFQSIFDYYDIYASKIRLTFYYSVYDSTLEEQIKRNQFDAVSHLLDEYGRTLGNPKGENLMHKLLLEGRLILKAI